MSILLLSACEGRQSALSPAGEDAAVLSLLFWVMLTGAVVIFCIMLGLFLYLTRIDVGALPARYTRLILVGGGIVWPTLTIGALLVWDCRSCRTSASPATGCASASPANNGGGGWNTFAKAPTRR